jgi:hypothetical protein
MRNTDRPDKFAGCEPVAERRAHSVTGPSTPTIDHRKRLWDRRVKKRAAPSAIFSQKAESDLMPTALARVRRLDCHGEGLLVRVKLAGGSTKANGPSLTPERINNRARRPHQKSMLRPVLRSTDLDRHSPENSRRALTPLRGFRQFYALLQSR